MIFTEKVYRHLIYSNLVKLLMFREPFLIFNKNLLFCSFHSLPLCLFFISLGIHRRPLDPLRLFSCKIIQGWVFQVQKLPPKLDLTSWISGVFWNNLQCYVFIQKVNGVCEPVTNFLPTSKKAPGVVNGNTR